MKLYLVVRSVDLAGVVVAAESPQQAKGLVSDLGSWTWKCQLISNFAHPKIEHPSIVLSSIKSDDD